MSLIPNLSDIPELSPVPDGEYDLRVTSVKEKKSKDGSRNSIMLVCEIIGEENALPVFHSLWLPSASDDEEKSATMWRMIKDFLISVGLSPDGELELEDFEDLSFSALLEYEDGAWGKRNNILRIT